MHLAGASIAGRFTDAHRAAIRDSRIEPTRRLAEVAGDVDGGPRMFVSASAVGYYGYDRGDTQLTEDSSRGDGFLADVVADWEAATAPAADAGLRVVPCAPASCRPPRAARCDCCGRCSPPGSAAGWAAARSGCPGSASTICSTSTTARSTTTG